MKLILFSVRDEKVEAFLPLIQARARGEATRMFVQACTTSDHQFAKAAGDYTLYELGVFDDVSGQVVSNSEPLRIMNGFEALEASKA